MIDEELKKQYNQSVTELKEALKRDHIIGWIYKNMILILEMLEKMLEKIIKK